MSELLCPGNGNPADRHTAHGTGPGHPPSRLPAQARRCLGTFIGDLITLAETQRLKRHTEIQILTLLRDLADTSGMTVDGVIVHTIGRSSLSGPLPPTLTRVEVGLRLS